jgi:PAS domain S-box-containing protein
VISGLKSGAAGADGMTAVSSTTPNTVNQISADPGASPTGALSPVADPARLAALRGFDLLDTPPEESFDQLARLASTLLDAPMALVSLVDEDRQFFKSCVGVPEPLASARETPVEISFCQHAVAAREPLLVRDAREVPLFRDSPLVHDGQVAYAGIPLVTAEGHALGTICVVDTEPRDWTEKDVLVLRELAARVMAEIENRRLCREAKERELELRASEERLRLALDAGRMGWWEWDSVADTIVWSENLERIFGLAPGTAPRTYEEYIGCVHTADRDVVRREIEGGFTEGRHELMHRVIHPDGSVRWIEGKGRVILDAEGRPCGMAGVASDVTPRRELEEQLLQSQKMEAVGRLAGGVAHDFNNLLTAITGYSEFLIDRFRQHDAPVDDLHDIEQIRAAAERATNLTRQLLAFSRKQALEPEVIDIGDVVGGIEPMLRRLIGEDIELLVHGEAAPGVVRADRCQLEQVIVNLAVNARDAMPQGGTLTIEMTNAAPEPELGLDRGPYVVVAVTDTGCGMDAATLAQAFEPFFTTKEQGTGLGLATVYGIVAQSGGELRAESERGRGSTFRIYLPCVDASVESRDVPASSRSGGGPETILLVEDECIVRQLARRILADEGYTVLDAADADDALRLSERHSGPIDLVLTDLVMPNMSGTELADRLGLLREESKVIYMSGYTDDAIMRHGLVDPGLAFLQKPFTPDRLRRKVREILDAA